MSPLLTLTIYCAAIVAASLAGGWIPLLVRLTHQRMELALSFISGVMLGVALLLLLPHAFTARMQALGHDVLHDADAHGVAHHLLAPLMLWLLGGFVLMFLIERFFRFHHHPAPAAPAEAACDHDHDHDHDRVRDEAHGHAPAHALTWSGAAIGLTLHSLIDGVALAASVTAAGHIAGHEHESTGGAAMLAGLGAFIVILLHKPFDSLTLGTLMAAGRHAPATRHIVNTVFALLVPIGAGLFMLGLTAGGGQATILSCALAFSVGTFLCIALSDVLPELQFHQHDRVKLSAALLLGLATAWAIAAMEARLH